jgi:DNA-directed RNA polymerase subunit M/transcription elongation factor TFIIS
MEYTCPECGKAMHKNGTRKSGRTHTLQNFVCGSCGYGGIPLNSEGKPIPIEERTVKK